MKNTKMFWVTAVILVLLFIVVYTTFTGSRPIEVKKYDMDIAVVGGKHIGINVGANNTLHFGTVPAGKPVESMRYIIITNGEEKTNVQLQATGVMGKWLGVSQNNFTMEPKQTQNLNVTIYVPEGTPVGNYTGTLIMEFFKIA